MSLNPQWLEGVDLEQPLSELIELVDLEIEAAIGFTLEELAYLEEQSQEYIQELREQGCLEELPPLDMPEDFREPSQDKDPDFGR